MSELSVRVATPVFDGAVPLTAAGLNSLLAGIQVILEGLAGSATIADGAVTAVKLGDLAVITAKLNDLAVTTAKIADANVTGAKLDNSARGGVQQYALGAQTATVYAVTLTPAATAYVAGQRVAFKADTANVGAVDINVNGLGAKNIIKVQAGAAAVLELVANDIVAGQVVEVIYDGTNFQLLTPQERSFTSAEVALTTGVPVNVAHGLGAKVPTYLRAVLVCKTAPQTGSSGDLGYAVGDEIDLNSVQGSTGASGFQVGANTTNVFVCCFDATPLVRKKVAGAATGTTASADWRIKVYART